MLQVERICACPLIFRIYVITILPNKVSPLFLLHFFMYTFFSLVFLCCSVSCILPACFPILLGLFFCSLFEDQGECMLNFDVSP